MKTLALALLIAAAPLSAQAEDPFSRDARAAIDIAPAVPAGTLPRADAAIVTKELAETPPSELNLRCQGLLTALGQAAKLRKDTAALLDTQKAIDLLQTALINEAVAATDAGYSVKDRLALARKSVFGLLPKAKEQAARFVGLIIGDADRDTEANGQTKAGPNEAEAQTLANQQAICSALLGKVTSD